MIAKRVVTISEQELPSVAQMLFDLMSANGFVPDAVVGIATGGALVVGSLPADSSVRKFTCTMRRPSTVTKQRAGIGRRVLKKMPYRVTNVLRLIEDRVGERSTPTVPIASPSLEEALDVVGEAARKQGLRSIAVIDDAVDSGATLACVMSALRRRLPAEVTVRSGVITRTRSPAKTIVEPDYVIYENILCRFHWSYDYKGTS
jgi:adenine/guanine phosphoribosyltransferase-like PRPP-binding protein